MNVIKRAKDALLASFRGVADSKHYTRRPQENLLPGIDLAKVEDDLRHGDGGELRMKFCAVHSSAALAVNCFAYFKDHPADVHLLGHHGAKSIEFEKRLAIFRGGRAPNIDVWIERLDDIVAVESKLLEYLRPTKPEFSPAYDRLVPPISESCWWNLYEQAKGGAPQLLDRAQLIRHYFGLNKRRSTLPQGQQLTLLYVFWEPLNWQNVDECQRHRVEVQHFADAVAGSQIPFRWTTYNELWEDWTGIPVLRRHAQNLKARYGVALG